MTNDITRYIDEGRFLLPIKPGEKTPTVKRWQDPNLAQPEIPDGYNVAFRLDNLVDVDCDCKEARAVAPALLLSTEMCHARPSRGVTHYWYDSPGSDDHAFRDIDGTSLIEIRTGRKQYTVVPPSRVMLVKNRPDEGTEELVWDRRGAPSPVDAAGLIDSVRAVATAALVIRHWPGSNRHNTLVALAGLLSRFNVDQRQAIEMLQQITLVAEGEIWQDCEPAVRDSYAKLESSQTTGAPTLEGILGKDVVDRLRAWWIGGSSDFVLNPHDPLPSARAMITAEHTLDGINVLRHQTGVFYRWDGSAYSEYDEAAVRARLYEFLERAKVQTKDGLTAFQPTKAKIENVLDALKAVANLPDTHVSPCWLRGDPGLPPLDMLACRNGLLHIPTRTLQPPTPNFFTFTGLDFPYEPSPATPTAWLAFLESVWPDDPASIDVLQEFFGYLLTPDTRFQKIAMIVGPKRSGKGTIARVLQLLVGKANTCSPTLGSFGHDFGKQVLVGKTLAVMSDARISGRTDTATVAETLLSISGEDSQTVHRKFLPDWNGTLAVRFLLLANELPRIADASGALASRFLILVMKKSFLGQEDLLLFDRISRELPGILTWALDGRARLYARGHFVQPASSEDMVQAFNDLGSSEATFLRERCEVRAGAEVSQHHSFNEWRNWCVLNGHMNSGTAQTFARSVRAVMPEISMINRRVGNARERRWSGLALKTDWRPVPETPMPY